MKRLFYLASLTTFLLFLTGCAPSASDAEEALRDLCYEQGDIELSACDLVSHGNNNFEGIVSWTFTQEMLDKAISDEGKDSGWSEVLSTLMGYCSDFNNSLVGESFDYWVSVIYDGRTLVVTDSEMTDDCHERLKEHMLDGLFKRFVWDEEGLEEDELDGLLSE